TGAIGQEEKPSPPSRDKEALERAICERVEAEVHTSYRKARYSLYGEARNAPHTQELQSAVDANIKREYLDAEAVFIMSKDLRLDYYRNYYLVPLWKKIIRSETKLIAEYKLTFTEDRIKVLKEILQKILMDCWTDVVYGAYGDAHTHVVEKEGRVPGYIEEKLEARRSKIEKTPPKDLLDYIDEMLKTASADSKLAAL
ncbi:MAG: hypothetical protein JOZ29_16640, partial [Deltaproteobacteria bacterium]|nr:hypothetical protein [Deltaproteobacteria bacterium]